MSTALRALAKAGVAGLVPILLAAAHASIQGTAAQASPGGLAALSTAGSGDPAALSRGGLPIRVVLPGLYDTTLWTPGPSTGTPSAFIPTPGSPIGSRAARLAERLERGHGATARRQASLR